MLFRSGSVGTAFLVTLLARRAQYHQSRLGDNLISGGANMQNQVALTARFLHDKVGLAYSAAQGQGLAQGNVFRQLIQQATLLSYLDVIKCFAIAMGVMVPAVFMMSKVKGGRGGGAAH